MTIRRNAPKIKRNARCPCGSGKKYKFCCLRKPRTLGVKVRERIITKDKPR